MRRDKKLTIAIDGPAASGKSTTARRVARRLDYLYIDTGAMYRAVTLAALRKGILVNDRSKVAELADKIQLEFRKSNEKTVLYLDGEDISDAIRTPEIDRAISAVAANPGVRNVLVKKQQDMGRRGRVVLDGRDIGTVVFPDADLKIFMVASVEQRALRRQKELEQKGTSVKLAKVMSGIRYRDQQDISRSHGPLKKAPDAIEIDTTHLTIDQQVEKILHLARDRMDG